MKRIYSIVALFSAVVMLTSCKDDDKGDPAPSFPPFQETTQFGPKAELLTGGNAKTWKFQNLLVNGQPLGMEYSFCQDGTRLTFYKAGNNYTTSVPAGGGCGSNNGKWNMSDNESQLRMYPLNETPFAYQIIELSDSVFHYTGTSTVDGQAVSSEAWMVPE